MTKGRLYSVDSPSVENGCKKWVVLNQGAPSKGVLLYSLINHNNLIGIFSGLYLWRWPETLPSYLNAADNSNKVFKL